MDKSLFIKNNKPNKSITKQIVEILVSFVFLVVLSGSVGGGIAYAAFWWKNTLFVDKLTYKWALEEQYNKGRWFERICNRLRNDRKEPLTPMQDSFCKRHDNYKDHPQELGE